MADPSKPEVLARNTIYRSRWVNLHLDKVLFPNGRIIEQHHLLDFDHQGVMAIVQDAHDNYLMVRVCRYTTGRTEWEFPAGGIETGEEIIEAARREVLEETGYHTSDHTLLYTYNPLVGIANQVFYVIRCKAGDLAGDFDTQEISEVRWFTSSEIWEMIKTNAMQDGFALVAFMLHQHL